MNEQAKKEIFEEVYKTYQKIPLPTVEETIMKTIDLALKKGMEINSDIINLKETLPAIKEKARADKLFEIKSLIKKRIEEEKKRFDLHFKHEEQGTMPNGQWCSRPKDYHKQMMCEANAIRDAFEDLLKLLSGVDKSGN